MHLLAISGSLRAGATNTALLLAAALLASEGTSVELYDGVARLPHFNPDLERDARTLPDEPARLRALVGRADGLLLSTPEYAHGLPGAFKNALDWLVGGVELPGKPVAILSPSAHSVHAPAQLREILTTMSACIVEPASPTVTLPRRTMTAAELAADPELAAAISAALRAMTTVIENRKQVAWHP